MLLFSNCSLYCRARTAIYLLVLKTNTSLFIMLKPLRFLFSSGTIFLMDNKFGSKYSMDDVQQDTSNLLILSCKKGCKCLYLKKQILKYWYSTWLCINFWCILLINKRISLKLFKRFQFLKNILLLKLGWSENIFVLKWNNELQSLCWRNIYGADDKIFKF